MKKAFCLIISVVLFSTGLFAQEPIKKIDHEAVREKVLKKKLAYYTENLRLTKEEYERFAPVYSQYDKEVFAIGAGVHEAIDKLKDDKWQSMNAQEAEELLKQLSEAEKQESDLKLAYFEKFKSLLPAKKVAKLMVEERSIKRKVMKCKNQKNPNCKKHPKDPSEKNK